MFCVQAGIEGDFHMDIYASIIRLTKLLTFMSRKHDVYLFIYVFIRSLKHMPVVFHLSFSSFRFYEA